jgi:hypothetical protein
VLLLDWQSDGIIACLALVLYGVTLLALVLPHFRRNAALARLLSAALLWRLVVWAVTAFWILPYYAAQGAADCYGYHHNGILVAELIRAGDWGNISWHLGTDTMTIITGFLYAPFGGNIYGMLFFSAVLGLCGGLYFCLAFSLWARPAQVRQYALIILFLPSFAMWTGSFGKDSWIALGLGLAAYGYSSILKLGSSTGLGHLLAGVAIMTAVRPHIAVTIAASMAVAYVWGMTKARHISIPGKVLMVVVLVGMFALLASVARGFLGLSDVDVSVESMHENWQGRGAGNAVGGSAVEVRAAPGVAGTLVAFPRAIVRELFQPFPWEVHNVNAGMAAGENLFILWFALSHLGRFRGLFREILREPYILFSSIFAVGLLFMLSLTPNLGLISRQRAQLLPFLFAPLVAAEVVRPRGARLRSLAPPQGEHHRPVRAPARRPFALPSSWNR